MDVKPLGSMPSRRTPAESFTGTVWQEPIIEAPAPARIRGAWVQVRAQGAHRLAHPPAGPDPARRFRRRAGAGMGRPDPGDPARRYRLDRARRKALAWRRPDANMVHIALQEHLDGTHVTWLEHVSDEQYNGKVER